MIIKCIKPAPLFLNTHLSVRVYANLFNEMTTRHISIPVTVFFHYGSPHFTNNSSSVVSYLREIFQPMTVRRWFILTARYPSIAPSHPFTGTGWSSFFPPSFLRTRFQDTKSQPIFLVHISSHSFHFLLIFFMPKALLSINLTLAWSTFHCAKFFMDIFIKPLMLRGIERFFGLSRIKMILIKIFRDEWLFSIYMREESLMLWYYAVTTRFER